MKAELVPENGDPPIPITRDVTVIGRREYCDVRIDDPSLSKRHVVVVKTDGLLVIRDLATTNGTKVKGQRIRWAALLPEDRIALGSYKIRVYLGPDDVPSPSERKARGEAPDAAPSPRPKAAGGLGFAPPSLSEAPGPLLGAGAEAASEFDDVIVLDEVDLLDAVPEEDDVIELG